MEGMRTALILALVSIVFAAFAQKPTLKQAEDKLVHDGYIDTLCNAQWAVKQGDAIVPILDQMLAKRKTYAKLDNGGGAFPFNAEYARAHIPSKRSLAVLEKYKLKLAIQGWKLRDQKKSKDYGVLSRDGSIFVKANQSIGAVQQLKAGTAVRILKRAIENPNEEGPRGGPTVYDEVEVLSTGRRGFVQRAGDNFDPFF